MLLAVVCHSDDTAMRETQSWVDFILEGLCSHHFNHTEDVSIRAAGVPPYTDSPPPPVPVLSPVCTRKLGTILVKHERKPINSDCAVLGHDAGDSPVEDDTVIVTWDGMLGGSETVMSTACH